MIRLFRTVIAVTWYPLTEQIIIVTNVAIDTADSSIGTIIASVPRATSLRSRLLMSKKTYRSECIQDGGGVGHFSTNRSGCMHAGSGGA